MTASVSPLMTFTSLQDAQASVEKVIREGTSVQASRIYEDRIRKPRSRLIKMLGVEKKAETECRRLEPNGRWVVVSESPGTAYLQAGVWGPLERQTQYHRFSAWYNRFLPYAKSMFLSEDGYECTGIDYNSINSYFGTCMGFVGLGLNEQYDIMVDEDRKLFSRIYNASMNVRPPELPFYEAYAPCAVYVALHKPQLIVKHRDKDSWLIKHIHEVCEYLSLPQPKFKW